MSKLKKKENAGVKPNVVNTPSTIAMCVDGSLSEKELQSIIKSLSFFLVKALKTGTPILLDSSVWSLISKSFVGNVTRSKRKKKKY